MANIAQVLCGPATIVTGTAGTYPTTDVGYTSEGVEFSYEPDVTPIFVHEETVAINAKLATENIKIVLALAESTLANQDKAMTGSSLSSDTITLGGGVTKFISVGLTGLIPATSKLREIIIPYMVATGNVGMAFKKDDKTLVPVEFMALKRTSSLRVCDISDFFSQTLAANTLTVTGAFGYRVDGESDAADLLDNILGGSLNDTVEVRIENVANAITVVDGIVGPGNIVLTGSGNFVMNSRLDRLTLTQGASGEWNETDRQTDPLIA